MVASPCSAPLWHSSHGASWVWRGQQLGPSCPPASIPLGHFPLHLLYHVSTPSA